VGLLVAAVVLALGFGLGLRPADSAAAADEDAGKPTACRSHVPHTTARRRQTTVPCPDTDQPADCPAG